MPLAKYSRVSGRRCILIKKVKAYKYLYSAKALKRDSIIPEHLCGCSVTIKWLLSDIPHSGGIEAQSWIPACNDCDMFITIIFT